MPDVLADTASDLQVSVGIESGSRRPELIALTTGTAAHRQQQKQPDFCS